MSKLRKRDSTFFSTKYTVSVIKQQERQPLILSKINLKI